MAGIQIDLIYDEQTVQEYILLEFQGNWEKDESVEIEYLPLGKIQMLDDKKVKIMSGIHDLIGEMKEMPEPMMITEKIKDEQTGEVKICVKGVCSHKAYFNTRPTPILERGIGTKKIKQCENVNPLFQKA